jgi:1-acyl-sn-glycerol-3-phosphate acyltransferase
MTGTVSTRGFLVSNHLSYLDILVLGAMFPCVFVSKYEVRNWPLFGWFARLAGTVFIRRDKRSDVARASGEITKALNEDGLVVLFPEGTSSGGETVLPFKPALFSSVVDHPGSISCASIEYSLDDGRVADEVCYWRDMTLLPHLLNLLGKKRVWVRVALMPYASDPMTALDRKDLARRLHAQVLLLKDSCSMFQGPAEDDANRKLELILPGPRTRCAVRVP